jgi:hypothetical protein
LSRCGFGLRAHDGAEACYVDWLDFSPNRRLARFGSHFLRIHHSSSRATNYPYEIPSVGWAQSVQDVCEVSSDHSALSVGTFEAIPNVGSSIFELLTVTFWGCRLQ